MGKNVQQITADFETRISKLEAQLEEFRSHREHQDARLFRILRSHRATILRLESGDTNQLHHTGGLYTLGSKLRVCGMPRALIAYRAVYGRPKQRDKYRYVLADKELITSVFRHGIPDRV